MNKTHYRTSTISTGDRVRGTTSEGRIALLYRALARQIEGSTLKNDPCRACITFLDSAKINRTWISSYCSYLFCSSGACYGECNQTSKFQTQTNALWFSGMFERSFLETLRIIGGLFDSTCWSEYCEHACMEVIDHTWWHLHAMHGLHSNMLDILSKWNFR